MPKRPWQVSWLPVDSNLPLVCSFPATGLLARQSSRLLKPTGSYTPEPVTVALPQRISTAFPFHPARSPKAAFRRTPGTLCSVSRRLCCWTGSVNRDLSAT